MPIIKSAKKRVKVATKAAVRNRRTKRTLKASFQAFQKSLGQSDSKKIVSAHAAAQSAIGQATKKHVIHKNKAARKQRQLAAKAKAAALAKKPATAKKAPLKKPVTKKSTSKK